MNTEKLSFINQLKLMKLWKLDRQDARQCARLNSSLYCRSKENVAA